MKYISLGVNCVPAYRIKEYASSTATCFFDWLRTDFACVLKILNTKCINEILTIENMNIKTHDDDNEFKQYNEVKITFKSLEKEGLLLMSHHDVFLNHDDNGEAKEQYHNELIGFIEKYKRRHKRLIELIQSGEEMCFIHMNLNDSSSEIQIDEFVLSIKKIDENALYCFVLLVREPTSLDLYIKYDNYLKINLSHCSAEKNKNNKNEDWNFPISKIDWELIFKTIQIHHNFVKVDIV